METVEWIKYGALALSTYPGAIVALKTIQIDFSPTIKSEQHLRNIVSKEAKKLGLDSEEIEVNYRSHPKYPETSCAERRDGKLALWMHPQATEKIVRHELYHIHKDLRMGAKKPGLLKYLFICEPRADLYGALGIRL